MRTFVDILNDLKQERLKAVNRKKIVQEAWDVFTSNRRHAVRVLKTELRNVLRQSSDEVRDVLADSVFTVEPYADSDSVQKISVRVAFIPSSGNSDIAAYEQTMLQTLVQTLEALGLDRLANDVCVNSLQHRVKAE